MKKLKHEKRKPGGPGSLAGLAEGPDCVVSAVKVGTHGVAETASEPGGFEPRILIL